MSTTQFSIQADRNLEFDFHLGLYGSCTLKDSECVNCRITKLRKHREFIIDEYKLFESDPLKHNYYDTLKSKYYETFAEIMNLEQRKNIFAACMKAITISKE